MTITSLTRRLHIPPASDAWGRTLRRAGIVYLLSRLFVVMGAAIAVAAQAVVDRSNDVEPTNGLSGLADILASWDGHWYLDVVREGYPHHIMPNVTYFVSDARAAFFPLYPRFVHYIDVVLPSGPVSMALAVNIILGACFVFLAGYLCRGLFDIKTAEKAMILIALFPGSFVLSMAYSEALMLTIVALCFIALRDKHWLWAGILAAMATATRPNGVALIAACAVLIGLYMGRKYKMNLIYWSYTAVILALMLIPATVTARPRFLFTAFPLFFPVARALRDDDDKWWPLVVVVMVGGLVTVMGIYGVRGAIP